MKLAVGTRFWGQDATKDLPRIQEFIESARQIGQVFVAVNSAEDKIDTVELFPDVAFGVTPWGKFVTPLNCIVLKAALAKADYLLMASAEFPPTQDQVADLLIHMGVHTLVVGAAMAEHEFQPGGTRLPGITGTTVPWNTFALWNLAYLQRLGIPLVGDGPFNPAMAGVEEACTIITYKKLWPHLEAKLVRVPGLGEEWNMTGWSEERIEKHRKKIQSKKDRAEALIDFLDLGTVEIEHLD